MTEKELSSDEKLALSFLRSADFDSALIAEVLLDLKLYASQDENGVWVVGDKYSLLYEKCDDEREARMLALWHSLDDDITFNEIVAAMKPATTFKPGDKALLTTPVTVKYVDDERNRYEVESPWDSSVLLVFSADQLAPVPLPEAQSDTPSAEELLKLYQEMTTPDFNALKLAHYLERGLHTSLESNHEGRIPRLSAEWLLSRGLITHNPADRDFYILTTLGKLLMGVGAE